MQLVKEIMQGTAQCQFVFCVIMFLEGDSELRVGLKSIKVWISARLHF